MRGHKGRAKSKSKLKSKSDHKFTHAYATSAASHTTQNHSDHGYNYDCYRNRRRSRSSDGSEISYAASSFGTSSSAPPPSSSPLSTTRPTTSRRRSRSRPKLAPPPLTPPPPPSTPQQDVGPSYYTQTTPYGLPVTAVLEEREPSSFHRQNPQRQHNSKATTARIQQTQTLYRMPRTDLSGTRFRGRPGSAVASEPVFKSQTRPWTGIEQDERHLPIWFLTAGSQAGPRALREGSASLRAEAVHWEMLREVGREVVGEDGVGNGEGGVLVGRRREKERRKGEKEETDLDVEVNTDAERGQETVCECERGREREDQTDRDVVCGRERRMCRGGARRWDSGVRGQCRDPDCYDSTCFNTSFGDIDHGIRGDGAAQFPSPRRRSRRRLHPADHTSASYPQRDPAHYGEYHTHGLQLHNLNLASPPRRRSKTRPDFLVRLRSSSKAWVRRKTSNNQSDGTQNSKKGRRYRSVGPFGDVGDLQIRDVWVGYEGDGTEDRLRVRGERWVGLG